jgi:hypothetical protein
MLKKHGYDWDGDAKDKIKQSVKDFISFKFQ